MKTIEERRSNLILVKSLELTDKSLAEELLSKKELEDEDLEYLVQDGLMNKGALKLNNSVLMKGMLNIINRQEIKLKHEKVI